MRQEISQFSRDEFPLSVVMLFDLTESVRGVLKHLAEGAKSAMAHFKPEDEVALMVYSGGATLVDDFTRDRKRTLEGIGKAAGMRSDRRPTSTKRYTRRPCNCGRRAARRTGG